MYPSYIFTDLLGGNKKLKQQFEYVPELCRKREKQWRKPESLHYPPPTAPQGVTPLMILHFIQLILSQ